MTWSLRVAPHGAADEDDLVIGAVIIIIVCCVALPVVVLVSTGVLAGILGWLLNDDVDKTHAGSELIDLNT